MLRKEGWVLGRISRWLDQFSLGRQQQVFAVFRWGHLGHFFEKSTKMGRVVETKFKGNFLILLIGKIDETLRLQRNSFQNDLLG